MTGGTAREPRCGEAGSAETSDAIDFEFGAGFRRVRAVELRPPPDRSHSLFRAAAGISVLPTVTGTFWIADAAAGELHIHAPDGRWLAALDRRTTGLHAPVGVTPLYGRWVAALDGQKPQIALLDETGRSQRRFPLPEVDRGYRICNVADRWLAVAGPGWRVGYGRTVHLYTTEGEYVESLFSVPSTGGPRAPFLGTFGPALYLSYPGSDSFAIYELSSRNIVSFPARAAAERNAHAGRHATSPDGFFVTQCGELLAVYPDARGGWIYDLYAVSGALVAGGIRHPERIVALEGPFFYSLWPVPGPNVGRDVPGPGLEGPTGGPRVREGGEAAAAGSSARLRVWRLSYPRQAAG